MKLWKIILGILGAVGALFAASSKSKEVKELKKVIKENKKKEKKVEKQIKELEEAKTSSKREVGNLKRKLTISKKKTEKMQEAYDKYFLVSFFVLSVASSQSYTQAEVLEMIKERDLQWQGKVDNANNLIASQKEVIDDSDRLIKELESQVKTDSLLLLKKSEQIELLKERDEANEKMIKLVKPKLWENRYLWFGVGFYLGSLLL